jgi:hypothetical protein
MFLIGILFSTLFSADQIVARDGDIVTVVASGEYIMGDSDNRKESRAMALTQAKTNASEVAGTYIESNFESLTQQTNDQAVDKVTKQELRSFSAAILQSEITNDTMELLADKTMVYKISIKARIDLATLRERVKQLGEDKVKKDRLIGLEKENKDLYSALEKLSAQMRTLENAKSVKPEEIKELREERDRLFTKLEKNEGATKLVFEKGSVLNEYQEKLAMATKIADVINNLFDKHFSEYVMVNIEKPKVIEKNGNMFMLEFEYSIHLDIEKFVSKLAKHSIYLLPIYNDREGEIIDELILNDRYYEKLGIYDILKKLIPSHSAAVVFSLPNSEERIYLFQKSYGSLFKKSCGLDRKRSLKFEVSEEQLSTFTEITSTIEVNEDSSDRGYANCIMNP